MDVHTPEQRRRNMQAIRNKATKEEVALAKALWSRGWRYKKNDKHLPGKPDLSFSRYRVVVFVDGEYFHGYNWEVEKHRIKTNREFWWQKIESNMQRDVFVNRELGEKGWTVMRFWSLEIRKNLASCVERIEETLIHNGNILFGDSKKIKDRRDQG